MLISLRPPRVTAARAIAALGASALVLALTGPGAVVAAAPDPPPPAWVPPVAISDPTSAADQLSVASDAVYDPLQGGKALAAWRTFDGEHWRIAVATDLGGRWTTPQLVSAPGVDAEHPSAGVATEWAGTTRFYQQVAWRLTTGEVQVAEKPAQPERWSAPMTVSEPGSTTGAPFSAVTSQDDGAGTYAAPAVAWLGRVGAHVRVHYLTWTPGQRPRPSEVALLSPRGHDAAGLDVSGSGPSIAWSWFDGTRWVPQLRYEGEWGSRALQTVPTAPGEDASAPVVDDEGVLWTSAHRGHVRLRASLRPGWGEPLGDARTVSTPGVDVSDVQVVTSRDDLLQVAWLESDGSTTRVATAAGDLAAGEWQEPTYLSPTDVQTADLATTGSGAGDVVWTQTAADGTHQVIHTRLAPAGWTRAEAVTPDGVDATDPVPVSSYFWQDHSLGVAWSGGPVVRVSGRDSLPPTAGAVIDRADAFSPPRVTWTSMDDWSPTASYDVRAWTAPFDGSRWTEHAFHVDGTMTSYSPALAPGTDYCLTVRATDAVGRVGSWYRGAQGDGTCVSTPADDRQLTRSAGWTRVRGHGYLDGSVLRSTRAGSTVSARLADAGDVRLLVAEGPRDGTITITWNGFHRTVPLTSVADRRRVWIRGSNWEPAGDPGAFSRVTVTVVSHGRPVRIDGLWADRELRRFTPTGPVGPQ